MSTNVSVEKQQLSEAERLASLEKQVAAMAAEVEKWKRERDEYKKLYELTLLELERTRRHLFGQKAERVDPAQLQMAFSQLAKALSSKSTPRMARTRRGAGVAANDLAAAPPMVGRSCPTSFP